MESNFFDISTKNRIVLAGNINLSSVFDRDLTERIKLVT